MAEEKGKIKVPAQEEVRIIDMKLKEVFLTVVGIMALAGVGYGAYSYIRAKTDQRRIETIGTTVSTIAREFASVIKDTKINTSSATPESPSKNAMKIQYTAKNKRKAS